MRQPVNLTNKLRIIFWFWFFAAIIITTNYSGALDSELTAPLDTDRIESLQELLEAQKSRKITVIVAHRQSNFENDQSINLTC